MMSKLIKTMDDVLHLGVGHGLMTRNAEFLLVDGLSNWQAKSMPIGITRLLVRRYGVMNDSLYASVGKKMLEFVTLLAEYRVDVEDAVVVAWLSDERVLDVVYVKYPHGGTDYSQNHKPYEKMNEPEDEARRTILLEIKRQLLRLCLFF